MEIVTITASAKNTIATLCNKTLPVEYEMILGYPRIVNYISRFNILEDNRMIKEIGRLSEESLRHFQRIDGLMARFGRPTTMRMNDFPKLNELADLSQVLEIQLEKENFALQMYNEAKNVALENKTSVRGREAFGKLVRTRSGLDEEIIAVNDVISVLNRLANDEERHVRIITDCIASLNMVI
jgi:hypothetical protein